MNRDTSACQTKLWSHDGTSPSYTPRTSMISQCTNCICGPLQRAFGLAWPQLTMCSYNQVNNSNACQNSYVLNHLIKNELGFQGFIISDWYATWSGVSSILAGLDMSMPGDPEMQDKNSGRSFWGANLTVAVLTGSVPTWRLDDAATRVMAA